MSPVEALSSYFYFQRAFSSPTLNTDMEGMSKTPPPSPSSMSASMNGTTSTRHKMMMHMTFYWGNKAEILFTYWPGDNTAMFLFALLIVFSMAILVECLSHCRFLKPGSNRFACALVQTLVHTFRTALSYLVMLALMSFNVPVFLVVVAGHAIGFFFFASAAFHESDRQKQFDLPPITC
ncbi:copper transporter 6-like [Neltuma alba]|uniref:copper transporter 6-like n=1 Tax=Neltuma alba TaxID=207710 RepID=UPI0010A51E9B|nr:copper transporter 6-like [Prosopis alba]